jgi:hypothetical protein
MFVLAAGSASKVRLAMAEASHIWAAAVGGGSHKAASDFAASSGMSFAG